MNALRFLSPPAGVSAHRGWSACGDQGEAEFCRAKHEEWYVIFTSKSRVRNVEPPHKFTSKKSTMVESGDTEGRPIHLNYRNISDFQGYTIRSFTINNKLTLRIGKH